MTQERKLDQQDMAAWTDVWDITLPWLEVYWDLDILARFRRCRYSFVSANIEDQRHTFEGTRDAITRFKAVIAANSDWLAFGGTLADIDRGRSEGKLVIGLHLQNSVQLEGELSRIESLRELGVRHMLLAYQTRNLIADGCAEAADAGLSNFGRRVVKEMNRVGMIVDGSHTGRRSSLEAIELSDLPPIFSHSNAYAVCRHIRNIHDEQIRACAENGGVVGVVGIGAFIGDPEAHTASLFRHIDYITTLVGPQHVGLGSDYVKDLTAVWPAVRAQKDSAWPDPTGTQLYEGVCFRPEQLDELVDTMLCHGYSQLDIHGILGGNFRRVYAMAERL